jgi:hypothetical protein
MGPQTSTGRGDHSNKTQGKGAPESRGMIFSNPPVKGSLETLMGKVGLRYEQDHSAHADARDLKDLLAVKHKGRTYLGRLLDSAA